MVSLLEILSLSDLERLYFLLEFILKLPIFNIEFGTLAINDVNLLFFNSIETRIVPQLCIKLLLKSICKHC